MTAKSMLCREPWSEIVPGLWQGGHDYVDEYDTYASAVVDGTEWDLLVSLYGRHGHGPIGDVEHLRLSIPDSFLDAEQREQVTELGLHVALAVADGARVLVRCQAGLNRSGLVVAVALKYLGWRPADAITRVRERRSPRALFNEHFVGYIDPLGGRA